MNELIKYFNNKYSKTHGKIAYPRTTLQIYQVYQIIKSFGIEDEKLNKLLDEAILPKPKTTEEKEAYAECIYESVNIPASRKYVDGNFPKKTSIEDNKLYLIKENGEKIDEGTELPSINVSKEYVDNSLENKVDKVNGKGLSTVDFTKSYETKLKGLENYNDTKVKEDIKTINTQLGDIANYGLIIGEDGKAYLMNEKGVQFGTGIKFPSDVDLSKVTMSMSGQTLKLMNDGKQISTVEIPTATVTDEQLTSIIQSKIDDGTLNSATITDKSITPEKTSFYNVEKINCTPVEVIKIGEEYFYAIRNIKANVKYYISQHKVPSATLYKLDIVNQTVSTVGKYIGAETVNNKGYNVVNITSDCDIVGWGKTTTELIVQDDFVYGNTIPFISKKTITFSDNNVLNATINAVNESKKGNLIDSIKFKINGLYNNAYNFAIVLKKNEKIHNISNSDKITVSFHIKSSMKINKMSNGFVQFTNGSWQNSGTVPAIANITPTVTKINDYELDVSFSGNGNTGFANVGDKTNVNLMFNNSTVTDANANMFPISFEITNLKINVCGYDLDNDAIDIVSGLNSIINKQINYSIETDVYKDRFRNKIVLFQGDSLCGGDAYSHGFAEKTFNEITSEYYTFDLYNISKSNTGLKATTPYLTTLNNFAEGHPTIIPDYILVFGTMNDGQPDVSLPLGTKEDVSGTDSVYGLFRQYIERIIELYPTSKIGFICSPQRKRIFNENICYGHGFFEEWIVAYKYICDEYGIPMLDLYHNSFIRPTNQSNLDYYFDGETQKGTHFNQKGHNVLSNTFTSWINSVF